MCYILCIISAYFLVLYNIIIQMTFTELELDRGWQKRGIMFKSGTIICRRNAVNQFIVPSDKTCDLYILLGTIHEVFILSFAIWKHMRVYKQCFCNHLFILLHPPDDVLFLLHFVCFLGPDPSWYSRWKKRVFLLKGKHNIMDEQFSGTDINNVNCFYPHPNFYRNIIHTCSKLIINLCFCIL